MTDPVAEPQFIYVAKVGQPHLSGWLPVSEIIMNNPMLTYRSQIPESQLPPGAPRVTSREVDAW